MFSLGVSKRKMKIKRFNVRRTQKARRGRGRGTKEETAKQFRNVLNTSATFDRTTVLWLKGSNVLWMSLKTSERGGRHVQSGDQILEKRTELRLSR